MFGEIELARTTVLAEQGRWPEAVPVLEAEVLRCQELFVKSSDDWKGLSNLIAARAFLVEARLRAGRISRTEAIAALPQILAETEADSRRFDRPSIRFCRALVLLRQAGFQAEAGDASGAESTLARAIPPLESETKARPQRLHWKIALARAVSLRGELHQKANRPDQALADARRTVKVVEPTVAEGSSYLYELGAFQTAYRALGEKMRTSGATTAPPDFPACFDTLKKAVSAGFDNVSKLREDPRLEPLRVRLKPEFERLVESARAAGKGARSDDTKTPPTGR